MAEHTARTLLGLKVWIHCPCSMSHNFVLNSSYLFNILLHFSVFFPPTSTILFLIFLPASFIDLFFLCSFLSNPLSSTLPYHPFLTIISSKIHLKKDELHIINCNAAFCSCWELPKIICCEKNFENLSLWHDALVDIHILK